MSFGYETNQKVSNSLGQGDTSAIQAAMKQVAYGQAVMNNTPGIVEMTEKAHQAFEVLSHALGDLMTKCGPLIEPYATEQGIGAGGQNQMCEAEAVAHMRRLIERINDKTAEIQRMTMALRV